MQYLIILTIVVSLFSPFSSSATTEKYSTRPNIRNIEARLHPDLPRSWYKFRPAHLEAIAEILEMYPHHQIYLLARDSEVLYDFAISALSREQDQLARIHLLNVSRLSLRKPGLMNYLIQEGISENALNRGVQFLFVDVGYSGRIPNSISMKFPEKYANQFKTHLLCSHNVAHPSTRSFMASAIPNAATGNPRHMIFDMYPYENFDRYTHSAESYAIDEDGHWEAISASNNTPQGRDSRSLAFLYMQDIKAFAQTEGAQQQFQRRREFWKIAYTLLTAEKKEPLVQHLRRLLVSEDPLREAIVRDFFDLIEKNYPVRFSNLLSARDVGLTPLASSDFDVQHLIEEFPEWKTTLENPTHEIQRLVLGGETEHQILQRMINRVEDIQFQIILLESLVKAPAHPGVVKIVRDLVNQRKWRNFLLPHYFFGNSNSVEWQEELKELIATSDTDHQDVVLDLFSTPHSGLWGEAAHLLIQRGTPKTLLGLARHALTWQHTRRWGRSFKLLLMQKLNTTPNLNQFSDRIQNFSNSAVSTPELDLQIESLFQDFMETVFKDSTPEA